MPKAQAIVFLLAKTELGLSEAALAGRHAHQLILQTTTLRVDAEPFVQIQQASSLPEAQGRLHWLDLFSNLLTPDGLRLHPSLHLDGTHMNPGYVRTIEEALGKLR